MNDSFSIMPLNELLRIILSQLEKQKSIFGISEELFFKPALHKDLQSKRFGKILETPLGVAAGPHTQLSQNIVAAWLCGARFIELKTIQALDEIDVSKPCIDMQDEGYNCEWSQELKIHQSFEQYLDAWIIIHILRNKFGWDKTSGPGFIFNMSVGYDLKGILNENVQVFLAKMKDASAELNFLKESLTDICPNIKNININPCISDNITLSTMHGCPACEIETIGQYLIENKKLHTSIKLNPTLIGKQKLNDIISRSGFDTQVPDLAFDHDLKYDDAIKIIKNLQTKADEHNLQFGVKLTNTLESQNHKHIFDAKEEMMYMSGKALHPISINLAAKLQNEFGGKLDISFSGGADAFNIAETVNCGLSPVTVCSDLLKPGGYGRLKQYIDNLNYRPYLDTKDTVVALKKYADEVLSSNSYKKSGFREPDIKTARKLNTFDCVHAPCVDTCPTNQDIPGYLYYSSKGDFEKAADIILRTNPFPHSTGMVCDHLCQTKCTRINYDSPVLIREIKKFVAENYIHDTISTKNIIKNNLSVSIIGAGPSGLSCAYFLAKAGFKATIYESKAEAGGMVNSAIPSFRLSNNAISIDINNIVKLGVEIKYNTEIDAKLFKTLRQKSNYLYIGIGARKSNFPDLQNINDKGVLDPLDFLFKVKENKESGIGKNVVIIGGGNTAMDAARTAYRLVGKKGKVSIAYRRTIKQMPADLGEIKAVLEEGIEIVELTSPIRIISKKGKIASLLCNKMKLGENDSSGRPKPMIIPNSEFEINMDTLIPAIGQKVDIDFASSEELKTEEGKYETKIHNVFIGGDALRGASTAINAIGDGRKAANEIIEKAGLNKPTNNNIAKKPIDVNRLMIAKSKRVAQQNVKETSLSDRRNFKLVNSTLSREEVINEAARCLSCDEICNVCSSVCPNLAFHSFTVEPQSFKLHKINKNSISNSFETFEIKQKHQILHLADWCNQCGNCTTFCPTAGSPYIEKPHLYFNEEIFDKEKDGFYFNKEGHYNSLYAYSDNCLFKLTEYKDILIFENKDIRAELNAQDMQIIDYQIFTKNIFEHGLQIAAEMKTVLEGAKSFYCLI